VKSMVATRSTSPAVPMEAPGALARSASMINAMNKVNVVTRLQAQINDALGNNFPPGPNCVPWFWIINLQKGGTLPFCLFLMYKFDNYSTSACFYTAAHGSYGLVWVLKHFLIRDPKWDTKTTVLSQLTSFLLVLGPYWLAPYVLISGIAPAPSTARCCAAMIVYVNGVVLMVVADCYKFVTLKHKRGLVTDGPFALIRNPNYLGEMMLYGAFASMVPHWIPWAVLAWVWLQLFLPNMLLKDASMSRYPEWDAYYQSTGLLLPWIPALFKSKRA